MEPLRCLFVFGTSFLLFAIGFFFVPLTRAFCMCRLLPFAWKKAKERIKNANN